VAPQVLEHPGARPTERMQTVDTRESSAARAHPLTEEQDDTVEAHYSGFERLRPCACMSGVVYIGHLVEADGEEVEVVEAVPCRRCAGARA
jgi:hypothetical protein